MILGSEPESLFDLNFIKKEEEAYSSSFCFCGGTDEVGRGPLAGPVVACTVLIQKEDDLQIFLRHLISIGVNDSKALSSRRRQEILKQLAIQPSKLLPKRVYSLNFSGGSKVFSLALISNKEIDVLNIHQASLKSMEASFLHCWRGVGGEGKRTLLLIDGKHSLKGFSEDIYQRPIIKGDLKSALIGLASIVAKEFRDHYMKKMSKKYPGHGWERNAGYPTAFHRESIKRLGPTPLHRRSFAGVVKGKEVEKNEHH